MDDRFVIPSIRCVAKIPSRRTNYPWAADSAKISAKQASCPSLEPDK
jgi:hypothetical protein